jgi:hypothetical protein
MPHTDTRDGLGLAPETRTRMEEVFGGRACYRCGQPAARLAGDRFYCVSHFLRKQVLVTMSPRVHRCSLVWDS